MVRILLVGAAFAALVVSVSARAMVQTNAIPRNKQPSTITKKTKGNTTMSKQKSKQNKNVRNNNPLNIELGDPWDGLAKVQKDSRFATFSSAEYGFRAAYIILLKYLERNDNTIYKIVAKWAPSFENHVDTYSGYVAQKTGKGVHDFVAPADLPAIILAMSDFEGAQGAYNLAIVNRGVEIAHRSGYVAARFDRLERNAPAVQYA